MFHDTACLSQIGPVFHQSSSCSRSVYFDSESGIYTNESGLDFIKLIRVWILFILSPGSDLIDLLRVRSRFYQFWCPSPGPDYVKHVLVRNCVWI